MFAGHFGVATAVKSKVPELPLWALLVSTQLIDLAFIPFNLAGLEWMEPIGEGGYGKMMIFAFYTHSFLGAFILSLLAGFLSGCFWGRRSGIIIGSVAFSHWILDLLVHRPDLPILPGNAGNLPLLGFGIWEFVYVSILIEFLLLAVGSFMYIKYLLNTSESNHRTKSIVTGCTVTLFLFLSLGFDAFL
ncbi:permease [Niallia sp. Krafla_26]|uniref:permease n=1 Tax=Niallia sp. Krafla_26 TaxID=3064703 RepID=UPI003D1744AF